jgi:micrococcal nuclease
LGCTSTKSCTCKEGGPCKEGGSKEEVMYEYYVKKVEAVVDGDTIDVLIDLGFDILFASRVRLAGIDTPESRTKDLAEKKLGLEAKEYLKLKLKDAKNVNIKTEKMDSSEKYGRILGWIFIDDQTVSINEQMITDGYAWGYLGDTKVKDFEALSKARKKSGK